MSDYSVSAGCSNIWTKADEEIVKAVRKHEPRPWPSARTLAQQTGYSVRTVRRTISKMRSYGWRIDSRWRQNGSQASNAYHLPQPSAAESARRSYRKAAQRVRVTPRSSSQENHTKTYGLRRKRRRWLVSGEVVPIRKGEGEELVVPSLTPGQQLFAAIVDELDALGMRLPRASVAIAARHGKMALDDGVDPDCVLIGCIVALRQGKGRFAHDYIAEVVVVKSGQHLNRKQYEHLLEGHKSASSNTANAERNMLSRVLLRKDKPSDEA